MEFNDRFLLSNGYSIPNIGYGLWRSPDDGQTYQAVLDALSLGYRHIDGASIYGNEELVGRAIAHSQVPRSELFITGKVWNTDRGYDSTLKAFQKTLDDLKTDYLDLYLIHWPDHEDLSVNAKTWKALETLYGEKRVRAIGVSNFTPKYLDDLIGHADILPMVDELENHPGHIQKEAVDYCKEHHIQVEAWSPLGNGTLMKDPLFGEMASHYGKDAGQLCLRFALQRGIIPLSKSLHKERISSNRDIFDFSISAEDMERLENLPPMAFSGLDPDTYVYKGPARKG
jgi:diketogulonate reductase-like aldo/keto reductase